MSAPWPKLKRGAIIDVIAPAGRFDRAVLIDIEHWISAQAWVARIPPDLLGDHDFLANSDAQRLAHCQQALYALDSDIVWCVRGGYGTTRILPALLAKTPPVKPKLLVGFSDITGLHVAINQVWQWPSLHAPMASNVACGISDERDVAAMLALWRGGLSDYRIEGLISCNALAAASTQLQGITTGTCLSLLQTSLVTPWQVQTADKLVFIEDINEPAYRLDRLLMHLHNAGLWRQARAIVLGDFSEKQATNEAQKVARVLAEFAENQCIPVFSLKGFGHGRRNHPLPLGVSASICRSGSSFSLCY